jgi:hypothetical protein
VQGGVDVLHGLGRQAALAVAAATGEQVAVEGGELPGGEPLEVHVAERRHDVVLDVELVAQPRRFPDTRRPYRWQPLLHQEALHRALGRLDEGAGTRRRDDIAKG